MANEANANININIDPKQALAGLRELQAQITQFNQSVISTNAAAVASQKSLLNTLTSQIGATKAFSTSITTVESDVSKLGRAIDKNKLSLGEYFKYGVASTRTFGRIFSKEHTQVMGLAEERVKRLQTQYIALEQAQAGVGRALAVRPMQLFNAETAIGIQRQQLFNKLLHDGSTSLINWGKNTQWAGRQLQVGFTVPLTIFGGIAGKIFMDLEQQVIKFRRVYGDATTPAAETDAMIAQIKELAQEYTKYGIAVSDTIALSADAAAMGAKGEVLMATTEQATKLATLGMLDQQQALTATMALQSAFRLNTVQLSDAVNFLNAVENQTVVSLDDITQAIPTVAPVIQGLGGDVEDLAIFMAAMREGGVNAAEGANALKSGLASLINPTKNAREQLKNVGINIDAILNKNRGNIRATVMDFGKALDGLSKFQRQQTLAKLFGKYQFARLGALFDNINKKGSQSQRVIELTGESFDKLGALADKELSTIAESTTAKFTGSLERLKVAIAPIGEAFLKIATPIIDKVTEIANKFNALSPNFKKFAVIATAALGIVLPTLVMLIGLFANFIGQIIKGGATITNFFAKLKGGAGSVQYLTNEELDAAAAAASLERKTDSLTASLNVQKAAVDGLTRAYRNYVAGATAAAGSLPRGFRTPRRMASGGFVGGSGNSDSEPALLMPGEFVVNKEATEKFAPVLAAMNAGSIKGYAKGSPGDQFAHIGSRMTMGAGSLQKLIDSLPDAFSKGAKNLVKAIASVFGDTVKAILLPSLGFMTTGDINRRLEKPGDRPVTSKEMLEDWDKRGLDKWKESLRRAGLKLDDVNEDLSLFDKTMRQRISSLGENGRLDDIVMKEIYDESIKMIPAQSRLRQSFDELATTHKEVRFNLRKSMLTSKGIETFQMGSKEGAIVGGRTVRVGAERAPFTLAGTGVSSAQLAQAGASGTSIARTLDASARREIGAASPARDGERLVGDYVDGMTVGASKNAPQAAAAGAAVYGAFSGSQSVRAASDLGIAAQTSDIRQLLKERAAVGPLIDRENRELQQARDLERQRNKEIEKRMLLLQSRGATPFGLRERAASQIDAERAVSQSVPVVPPGATMLPIVAGGAIGGTGGNGGRAGGAAAGAGDEMDDLGNRATSVSAKLTMVSMAATTAAGGLSMMDNEVGNTAASMLPFLAGIDALSIGLTTMDGKWNKVGGKFKSFGSSIKGIGTGLVAFLGKIPFVGKFVSLFQKLGGVIAKVAGAFMRFSGLSRVIGLLARFAAFLGPQGIIAILIAVGVALVGVWNKFQAFRDAVAEIGSSLKELFESLFGPIGELSSKAEAAGNIFSQIWEGVLNVVGPVFTVIAKSISIVIKVITIVVQAVKNGIPMIANAFTTLLDNLGPVGDFIQGIGQQIAAFFQAIPSAVSTAWNGLMNLVGVGINFVIDKINLLIRAMKAVKLLSEDVSEISQFSMADRGAVSGTVGAGVAQGEASKKAAIAAEAARDRAAARRAAEIPGEDDSEEDDTGGGGGKTESWLEKLLKDTTANMQLFVGDLKNKIKPIVEQLRGMNIPERLIDAIGTGEEGLKNAMELKGMSPAARKKFLNNLMQTDIAGFLSELEGKRRRKQDTNAARVALTGKVVDGRKIEKDILDQILQDENAIQTVLFGTKKQVDQMIRGYRAIQDEEDPIKKATEEIRKQHEEANKALDKQIEKQQEVVDGIQSQIDALEKKNEEDQWAIRGKEREKELIDRQIESLERANEMDERRIETLQRQDELRNREAEALDRELSALSDLEDQIRNSYQQRIDALDGIAEVNQHIINQQKQQLGLSQALAEGDIYAATAAAREMQQSQTEFAQQQMRSGLEQGMENAIAGLTTSGGLTREQAEQRINQIKEQSYQTSLLIRDIEDTIYNRNLEMIPLKDRQYALDIEIRNIADQIYNRETDIYNKRTEQLDPQQKILDNLNKEKDDLQKVTDETISQIEALGDLELGTNETTKRVDELAQAWYNVAKEIDKANKLADQQKIDLGERPKKMAGETSADFADRVKSWEAKRKAIEDQRASTVSAQLASGKSKIGMYMGGKVKKYAFGGNIRGNGSRDSISAMLTPGEFIVRKAMVDKYGTPLLSAINQGAFTMPKYSLGQSTAGNVDIKSENNTNILAPMYNNYSVNVSVSNANASADEIANKTIMKIKQMQDMQVRGSRGY